VDLDLHALQAKGLSPVDVVNAVSAQNLIAPSGTMKIDRFEYAVETNSAPQVINELNNLPIKAVNGAVIYIRDVAHVRDGNPPQTNILRVDGQRSIMMAIMKTGSASTLDIIKSVHEKLDSTALRGSIHRRCRSSRSPTSRSSSAAPSTAWCAKPSSPPASRPS